MVEVIIKDETLRKAAEEGMDAFLTAVKDAVMDAIGGELTSETMAELNADQITLLAYLIVRDEVMNGGFVQLIHNGYGGFIFLNPFAKAMQQWGVDGLRKIISRCHSLYVKYHEELEKDWTQEEFDALYEQYPQFDDFDDEFISNEEEFTEAVATYVDDHLDHFVKIEK
ncbi:MAG: DMP19 family protein [Prevotella sp.]